MNNVSRETFIGDYMKHDYYYDIDTDIKNYPNAWAYIIIGGRNCGKTYGSLKSCLVNNRKFVFLKRTGEDVDLLCAGTGKVGAKSNEFGVDLSPFKSINRDLHSTVKAYSIKKGLGGFWEHDEEDVIKGSPIGYLLALNYVTKFKGFDLADCDWLIFDEFIPQTWDRINRKEGEQLMDLYKTVSRDREHRGKEPLKLICLANATSISNPTMNILEITDTIAQMQVEDIDINYIKDRGILIHIIKDNPEFLMKEKSSAIYSAMGQTAWGRMAFDNQFAYNDFSSVGRVSLKGYKPVCSVSFKNDNYYIYQKAGHYYMTKSRHDHDRIYNLNKENDQKLFYIDYAVDLRSECIEDRMTFETFTMYDLIVNYRKYFNV